MRGLSEPLCNWLQKLQKLMHGMEWNRMDVKKKMFGDLVFVLFCFSLPAKKQNQSEDSVSKQNT